MDQNQRAVLFLLFLAGCGGSSAPEAKFVSALPPLAELRIAVPAGSGPSATKTSRPGRSPTLVGQTADLYVATRRIAGQVNGLVGSVLRTLWDIAGIPPTSVGPEQALWGPFTPVLSPVTYRLVVAHAGPDRFTYELGGRPKGATGEDAFTPFLKGESASAAGHRQGTFAFSLTALHSLDPVGTEQTGAIGFAFALAPQAASLRVHLQDVAAPGAPSLTADAVSDQGADASGDLRFGQRTALPDGASREAAVRSRWTASGAGRADAAIDAGSADGAQRLSECWNANFARVFFSAQPGGSEGDPSACAFPDSIPPAP